MADGGGALPAPAVPKCWICNPSEARRKFILKTLSRVTIHRESTGKPHLVVTPNDHITHMREMLKLDANTTTQSAGALLFGSNVNEALEELYNWCDKQGIKDWKLSWAEGAFSTARHCEIELKLAARSFLKLIPLAERKFYGEPLRCRSCPREYLLSPADRMARVRLLPPSQLAVPTGPDERRREEADAECPACRKKRALKLLNAYCPNLSDPDLLAATPGAPVAPAASAAPSGQSPSPAVAASTSATSTSAVVGGAVKVDPVASPVPFAAPMPLPSPTHAHASVAVMPSPPPVAPAVPPNLHALAAAPIAVSTAPPPGLPPGLPVGSPAAAPGTAGLAMAMYPPPTLPPAVTGAVGLTPSAKPAVASSPVGHSAAAAAARLASLPVPPGPPPAGLSPAMALRTATPTAVGAFPSPHGSPHTLVRAPHNGAGVGVVSVSVGVAPPAVLPPTSAAIASYPAPTGAAPGFVYAPPGSHAQTFTYAAPVPVATHAHAHAPGAGAAYYVPATAPASSPGTRVAAPPGLPVSASTAASSVVAALGADDPNGVADGVGDGGGGSSLFGKRFKTASTAAVPQFRPENDAFRPLAHTKGVTTQTGAYIILPPGGR